MSSLVSHPSGCAPACASRQQRCGVHSPEPVQLLCQSLSWKPPCHSGLQSHRRCLQKQAEEIPISDQLLYHWLVPSLAWWCFRCVWHQRSPSVSFITHIHTCTHMHTHYTHAHTLHAHTLHTCTHITRTHMHTHAHNMHTHYTTCTHMHTHAHTLHNMHTHYTHAHTCTPTHTHSHTTHMNTELVANRFLEEVHLEDKERAATIVLCKHFHQSTRELSERWHDHLFFPNNLVRLPHVTLSSCRFKAELGRHNYVTPTSYLELISSFKTLLANKRNEVMKMKKRYEVGLEKLAFAASQVRHESMLWLTFNRTEYCEYTFIAWHNFSVLLA